MFPENPLARVWLGSVWFLDALFGLALSQRIPGASSLFLPAHSLLGASFVSLKPSLALQTHQTPRTWGEGCQPDLVRISKGLDLPTVEPARSLASGLDVSHSGPPGGTWLFGGPGLPVHLRVQAHP